MTKDDLLRIIWNEAETLNAEDQDEIENGLRRIAELARAGMENREPHDWAVPTL